MININFDDNLNIEETSNELKEALHEVKEIENEKNTG